MLPQFIISANSQVLSRVILSGHVELYMSLNIKELIMEYIIYSRLNK